MVELMIVKAIIGILAAILVPNMIRSRNQSKLSACEQNLRNLASMVETYATANGGRYPTALADLSPSSLKVLPSCPVAGSEAPYTSGYESATEPDEYTISCKGIQHTSLGLPADFPQYSASTDLRDR